MTSPKYDPTINLGHILTIIMLLLGGLSAWTSVNNALTLHDKRIQVVEEFRADFKPIASRLTTAESRLAGVDADLLRQRTDLLEFQRTTVDQQREIMETLTQIREAVAGIKGSGPR